MDRFSETNERFHVCLYRSISICHLQGIFARQSPVIDTTDMLRSSVVLSVSAFDFLVHEVIRIEVRHRAQNNLPIRNLQIPYDIAIEEGKDFANSLEMYVKEVNSYKSFFDPEKYSDSLRPLIETPWLKVCDLLNVNAKDHKFRIKAIYRWRNRIAHEADINPDLSGIRLWGILQSDVEDAISDIRKLGEATVELLRRG
jgi:hypothetical protein